MQHNRIIRILFLEGPTLDLQTISIASSLWNMRSIRINKKTEPPPITNIGIWRTSNMTDPMQSRRQITRRDLKCPVNEYKFHCQQKCQWWNATQNYKHCRVMSGGAIIGDRIRAARGLRWSCGKRARFVEDEKHNNNEEHNSNEEHRYSKNKNMEKNILKI